MNIAQTTAGGKGPPPQTGLVVGRKLRDEALDLFARHRPLFLLRGQRALLQHMLGGNGVGSIDDVHQRVALPRGMSPKTFGGVPKALVADGVITSIGFRTTSRAEAHGRPVRVWQLTSPEAARAWLETHPEPDWPADLMDGPQHLLPLTEAQR